MKTWESAVDAIRRRTPTDVATSIRVQSPFLFDPAKDTSDMPDFLDTEWKTISASSNVVIQLPGRDINLARDLLICASKFFHVLDCARQTRARGALTWTLVDAYHAALLGTRLIAALYGVLTYSVQGRAILVDFRPELGSIDEKKRFVRDNRGMDDPIRILRPAKQLFEQKHAWLLVERLCNVTPDFESERNRIEGLLELARRPLSTLRNQVLYDSVYWTWRADFELGTADENVLAKRFNMMEEPIQQFIGALTKIHQIASSYTMEFCAHIGFDTALLPAVARQPPGEAILC